MSASIDWRETTGGILLPVQAHAGARREGIVGVHAGRLKVAVTQIAERGKANAELGRVLATALRVKRSQIELHSGATSPCKLFLIRDMNSAELQQRLIPWLQTEGPDGPSATVSDRP
jgi:hypothetical protein